MNIQWHEHKICKKNREDLLGQRAILFWFTGLSGSGKSTIASLFEEKLHSKNKLTYLLDGDNIRHGINSNLGFSKEDREENIRRISEVSKLFVDAGIITLACFISPYKKDRDKIRKLLGKNFVEVYIKCSLDECEKRDPKGLYKKARKGEIKNFTGINDPYEEPENPEIILDTNEKNVEECVKELVDYYDTRLN